MSASSAPATPRMLVSDQLLTETVSVHVAPFHQLNNDKYAHAETIVLGVSAKRADHHEVWLGVVIA